MSRIPVWISGTVSFDTGDWMQRKIVDFYQDEAGDWTAMLECGHGRHVRHDPPWTVREWVTTETGRAEWIGRVMECTKCDEQESK